MADVYPRPCDIINAEVLSAADRSAKGLLDISQGPLILDTGFFSLGLWYIEIMEIPNTENVAYLDEYPHLSEKVRLRRLGRAATLGPALIHVLPLPLRDDSDFRSLMEEAPQVMTHSPDDSA